jgi:hypothetical protein
MMMMKKVSMKLEYGVNKDYDKLDKWQQNSNQYTATVKYNGKQLTTPFFTGYGWTKEPTWKDVLGSLVMDTYSYENSQSFEDFCSEFGYDSDSRSAKKIYDQLGKTSKKVKRLLGNDFEEVAEFLNEEGY